MAPAAVAGKPHRQVSDGISEKVFEYIVLLDIAEFLDSYKIMQVRI